MITIVDYGMGNLGSIQNMFRRIGAASEISSDLKHIGQAKKIMLPGVGAFDSAMERINQSGLREVLDKKALVDRVPVLGICLGMQLLTRSSEEGKIAGLGWVNAETRRFPSIPNLKVPHMGWNLVHKTRPNPLTDGLADDARFYFVHSYYVSTDNPDDSLLETEYGIKFDSVLNSGNIYGAQFHPEKSHKFGMTLLSNFAGLSC
jgi:glutamine amidotransferase